MTTNAQFRAVTERRSLDRTGLEAALVGTTNTGVLLFLAPAVINSGVPNTWPPNLLGVPIWATASGIDLLTPAEAGTQTKITRRGQWLATLSVNVIAQGSASFGISYQTDDPDQTSTPGLLAAATPINTAAGIRQGVTATAPLATVIPVTLTALISVSDRDAGDPQSGVIRFHGTGGGAGGIIETADLEPTTARYTITYLGDLMGS